MTYVRLLEIFEKSTSSLKGIGDVAPVLTDRGCSVMLCEF